MKIATAAAMLLGSTVAASALGTAAGTDITNTISVEYDSGGTTITDRNASSVTFKVDRKIDFAVEGQDAGKSVSVSRAQEHAVQHFAVTNESNDVFDYDFTVTHTPGANPVGLTRSDTATTTDGEYFVVYSPNDTFGDGDDIVVPAAGLPDRQLAKDTGSGNGHIHNYFIVSNIDTTVDDASEDTFTLTVQATDGAGTALVETATPTLAAEDVIFADPGTDGTENDAENLLVSAPDLTITKTVEVMDENIAGNPTATCNGTLTTPVVNAAAIPGSCIRYVISASNDAGASAAAANLEITDVLPSEFAYSQVVNHGTPANAFTTVGEAGGTVTGTITSLAAGETRTFYIYGKVN
jgi:uncharacterized repeat protein (TIGR01451 family)